MLSQPPTPSKPTIGEPQGEPSPFAVAIWNLCEGAIDLAVQVRKDDPSHKSAGNLDTAVQLLAAAHEIVSTTAKRSGQG